MRQRGNRRDKDKLQGPPSLNVHKLTYLGASLGSVPHQLPSLPLPHPSLQIVAVLLLSCNNIADIVKGLPRILMLEWLEGSTGGASTEGRCGRSKECFDAHCTEC